ncbi:hypothetical protein [Lysobacter sp. A03]|uniref:hypothetical protein n=1 Tax=Lysobacter sp. A03 TaxID=1199154 RepID=UPI001269F564|nr:hypothetical protein [Lysobacter sp. A03]
MNIALGANLAERTRRQYRDADYLVQYYSPLPEGAAKMDYCTYQFYLQGQVFGSGEIWDREDGTQPYFGPM